MKSRGGKGGPTVPRVALGKLQVSRLIVGGNMFSGFSHISPAKDAEMTRYYTAARIKATLRRAEELGMYFEGHKSGHLLALMVAKLEEYLDIFHARDFQIGRASCRERV